MRKSVFFSIPLLVLCACSQKHVYTVGGEKSSNTKSNSEMLQQGLRKQMPLLTGENGVDGFMPDATAFRMSGDYANNVAITLNSDGDVLYYPAPTDITADSEPLSLGDGWWLNRQGVGENTVFTKYTFAEYAALPSAPSIEQLKLSIIPGAKVTQMVVLPIKLDQALQNPDAAKEYLKNR